MQSFLYHETSHGLCYNNSYYECLRLGLAGLLDIYYVLLESLSWDGFKGRFI